MRTGLIAVSLAGVLLMLTISACPSSASSSGSSSVVSSVVSSVAPVVQPTYIIMSNYMFMPTNYIVAAGQTVYWTNMDIHNHNVTNTNGGPDGNFFSGKILTNDGVLHGWSKVFTNAGTNHYICTYHYGTMGMDGWIIVTN